MAGVGLFSALDVAISGMFVSRMATQITNHNIANANTPGYSRQSLRIGSRNPLTVTYGTVGRGAQSLGVQRSRNDFLQRQVTDQTSLLGDYSAMDETLRSIESILGSMDDDRVGSAMNDFFAAWSDLATPPMTDGKRASVVKHGESLAMQFNEIDASMAQLERDTRMTFDAYIDDANMILEQVADLNGRIVAETSGDQVPHDLVDQRTRLLDELSGITRFTTVERADGTADVIINGHAMVTRGHVNELRIEERNLPSGGVERFAVFGGRNPQEVTFEYGAVAGYQRMYNEILPRIREDLDELAKTLVQQVNDLHRQGVTPRGVGVDFFTGDSAATMRINSALDPNTGDPSLVATGRSGDDGDNELALEIAALSTTLQEGQDATLNETYSRFIVSIATDRGSYGALLDGQESIVESARSRLESEKGVSLDEELANLIMYQRTYEANARVIRVVDEMLNTLVNGLI